MGSLHEVPAFRRPLAINLAQPVTGSHCSDCGARHRGLCDALSDEDLAFLARVAQRVVIQPATLFMQEGEPATYFYNINLGTARLFKMLPDGRRQITGFAGAGHFLGLAGQGTHMVSAESMDALHVCRFNRATLLGVFEEFPALERKLLDMAMHELVIGQEQMLLLGRKTAVERVASFLLAWAERLEVCAAGELPKANALVTIPLSRTDLADYLGLTIETVSRSLSQLKRDGLIDIPTIHEIRLRKPETLSDIAEAAI